MYPRFTLIVIAICVLVEVSLHPLAYAAAAFTGGAPARTILTVHDAIMLAMAACALTSPHWLVSISEKPALGLVRGILLSAPFLAAVWLVTLIVEGSSSSLGRLNSGAFWLLCLGAASYVALAEELLLRGAFQAFLERRVSVRATLWLQGLVFMLLHIPGNDVNVIQSGFYFVAGVLLTLAFLRWRSIWTAIGIHFVWDVSAFALQGFSFRHVFVPGLVDPQPSLLVSLLFSVAILAALIILLTREETQEALELRAPPDNKNKGKKGAVLL